MLLIFVLVYLLHWGWLSSALISGIPAVVFAVSCAIYWSKKEEGTEDAVVGTVAVLLFWPIWLAAHTLWSPFKLGKYLRTKERIRLQQESDERNKKEMAEAERKRQLLELEKSIQLEKFVLRATCPYCEQEKVINDRSYIVRTDHDRIVVCQDCLPKFKRMKVSFYKEETDKEPDLLIGRNGDKGQ